MLLYSDLRRTNESAGSSERRNAKQAPLCPHPRQPSVIVGMAAAIRPTLLALDCCARRSARHGRLSFARPVA